MTVKPFARLALCASGLVTVTVRVPVVALAAMVMLAVICVAELKAQEFTVIPVPKLQLAPLRKFVPVRTAFSTWPCMPLVGFTPLTVGAGPGGAIGVFMSVWISVALRARL